MNWKKPILLTLVITLILTSTALTGLQITKGAEKDNRINPVVDGPENVFVNVTEVYEVEIKGVFEVDDNLIEAENADNWSLEMESSLDATVEPNEQESTESNIFTVNVTIHEEGTGNLNITAYCGKGGKVSYSEKQLEVRSEEPEETTVPITNPTDTTIQQIELGFFVDGEKKSTITIEDLSPNEEKTVTFRWSKRGLSSGEHDLEVWVDYGTDNEPDRFNKQELIMDRTFHVEGEPNTLLYGAVIALVIAASFVVFLFYQSRKRKRRRPW